MLLILNMCQSPGNNKSRHRKGLYVHVSASSNDDEHPF